MRAAMLTEFSGAVLSCITLSRWDCLLKSIAYTTEKLAYTCVRGNCLLKVMGQEACQCFHSGWFFICQFSKGKSKVLSTVKVAVGRTRSHRNFFNLTPAQLSYLFLFPPPPATPNPTPIQCSKMSICHVFLPCIKNCLHPLCLVSSHITSSLGSRKTNLSFLLDIQVASLNPSRSSGTIFFSSVNFVCWLLFNVRSMSVLLQWP